MELEKSFAKELKQKMMDGYIKWPNEFDGLNLPFCNEPIKSCNFEKLQQECSNLNITITKSIDMTDDRKQTIKQWNLHPSAQVYQTIKQKKLNV